MAAADEEYRRKRANLELICDEFRRSNGQYPPLYHERVFCRRKVSCRAWRALAASRPHHTEWEYWHGPEDGSWYGRFFGSNEGLNEFKRLCESVSTVLPEIHRSTAVTDWTGIVHGIAEKHLSPLLGVAFCIWDTECERDPKSDNSWDKFYEWLEIESDRSEKFSEDMQIHYPESPAQRTLKFNVFTSSVAAIQIIMEPHLVIPEGENYDELPLVLLPPEAEKPTPSLPSVKVEDAIFLTAEGVLPDFLFKQVPKGWLLRFVQGDTVEQQSFPDLKGLQHYHKLLMSPQKTIACLDLDPPPGVPESALIPDDPKPKPKGSVITADEFLSESAEKEDFTGFLADGGSHTGLFDHGHIQELKQEADSLAKQIKYLQEEIQGLSKKTGDTAKDAANAELKQKNEKIVKMLKADFNEKVGLIHKKKGALGKGTESEKAFRRVKKVIRESLCAIRDSGMYELYRHLDDTVDRDGWGYAYCPHEQLPWTL